jgi:hypothetical protein
MTLSESQIDTALSILADFQKGGEEVLLVESNKEGHYKDLDDRRLKVTKDVEAELNKFFSGQLSLSDFKTHVDSINKKNRLWGFRGMSGQMFFNMLYNSSSDKDALKEILIESLKLPPNIEKAKDKINKFVSFVESIKSSQASKMSKPRVKSSLYFLSYFWQIQDNNKFPILYNSIETTLKQLGFLSENGDLADYYENFYYINNELRDKFKEKVGAKVDLWYVEHAIWYYYNEKIVKTDLKEPIKESKVIITKAEKSQTYNNDYLPPILADLSLIAKNDPSVENKYKIKDGKELEYIFEEKVLLVFKYLGFEVTKLGAGHRDPDGIAKNKRDHYAIIYDCKCRKDGFKLLADDERTMIEYIQKHQKRLKDEGIDRINFAIISSNFGDIPESTLKKIERESKINEIVLIRADQLLEMLIFRFIDPSTDYLEKLSYIFQNRGTIDNIREQLSV